MVLGEDSLDLHQSHLIAKMIKRHEPEYVLLGDLDNMPAGELEKTGNFYKVRTLEDVFKPHGYLWMILASKKMSFAEHVRRLKICSKTW